MEVAGFAVEPCRGQFEYVRWLHDLRLLAADASHAFNLHLRAKRKAVDAEGRPCGQSVGGEVFDVDFVEIRPFAHVCKHHGAFDHVVEAEVIVAQNPCDVFHGLAGLGFHAALHESERAGNVSQATGEV